MNPFDSIPTLIMCSNLIIGVDDETHREYLFKLLETLPINLIMTNLISLIGWKTNLVHQLSYIK